VPEILLRRRGREAPAYDRPSGTPGQDGRGISVQVSQRLNAVAVTGLLVAAALVWSSPATQGAVVAQHPSTGSLSSSPADPIVGERVTFSGRVPAQGSRPVKLQRRQAGAWRVVARGTTSSTGRFTLVARAPRVTGRVRFQAMAPAGTFHHQAMPRVRTSRTTVSPVAQAATLTGPDTATTGTQITLHAQFTPARRGREVDVERRTTTGWTEVAKTAESRTGRATWQGAATKPGGPAGYRAVAARWDGARRVTATHTVDLTPLWRAPTLVSKSRGILTSISCPTSTWCMAGDAYGNVTTYDGSGWSTPVVVDSRDYLYGMSCPTTTFCAAIDAYGYAVTFDGSGWSDPVRVSSADAEVAVSCGSVDMCVAANLDGTVATWDGTSWSEPISAIAEGIVALSCADATHCVAVDGSGNNTYVFDGSTWSGPTRIAPFPATTQVYGLSCPTSTMCMGVTNGAGSFTYDGSAWSSVSGSAGTTIAVSCPSATSCLATGYNGQVVTWDGMQWLPEPPQTPPSTGLTGNMPRLSCPTDQACVAISGTSDASVLDGTTWTVNADVDPRTGGLVSVSCVDPGFCAAADADGNVTTWDGLAWSAPVPVDSHGGTTSISCGSRDRCALVDDQGWATTYDGSTWQQPVWLGGALRAVSCPAVLGFHDVLCIAVKDGGADNILRSSGWTSESTGDDQRLDDISCASNASCMAVDAQGRAVRLDGTTWESPVTVDPGGDGVVHAMSVSCPGIDSCEAVAQRGPSWSYDGSTWADSGDLFDPVQGLARLTSLSCASGTFCVVVGLAGTSTSDGTTWSHDQVGRGDELSAVSCPTTSFCAAVDRYGNARVYE
jgi:hypothetical protein